MDGILKSSLLSSRCWPGHRKARLDCNIFCIFNMQQNRDLHILNIPLWEKFLAYLTPRRVAIFLFRVATFSPSCTTSLKLTSTPRNVNMFYILRFIEEKTGDPRRVNFWCTFYITKIRTIIPRVLSIRDIQQSIAWMIFSSIDAKKLIASNILQTQIT